MAGEVLGGLRARVDEEPILVVPAFQDVEHAQRELAEAGAVFGVSVLRFDWLFRELAGSSMRAVVALVSQNSVAAFDHGLHACMVLGSMYEYARRRFEFQSTSSGSILKTLSSTRSIHRQGAK